MSGTADSKPIDRWLPWLFVVFFAVVLIVNGIMVYVAAASWTGLETKQYYVKGLAYNKKLQEVERQKALGWTGTLAVEPETQGRVRLYLSLQDHRKLAIAGATVIARFVRPTSEGHDEEVRMDDLGGGRYAGTMNLPLPGQWDVRVVARHPSGDFRLTRRIMVR